MCEHDKVESQYIVTLSRIQMWIRLLSNNSNDTNIITPIYLFIKEKAKCRICRGSSFCLPHDRIKATCRVCCLFLETISISLSIPLTNSLYCRFQECKANDICKHGSTRSGCEFQVCQIAPTASGSICEHDRIRYRCNQCGGAGICVHDRQKARYGSCLFTLHSISSSLNGMYIDVLYVMGH